MKNSIVNQNEFFIMILIIFFNSPWNFCARVESVDDIFWIASRVFFSITCFANCAVFISICVVQHDPADGTSQYRRLSEKSRKKWNLLVFYVFCSAIRECRCCVQRIESCSSNAFRSRVWFSWGFQRAFYSVLTNEKKKKVSAWPLRDLTSHLGNAAAVHPHPNTIQAGMSARDRDRRERGWEQNEEGEK